MLKPLQKVVKNIVKGGKNEKELRVMEEKRKTGLGEEKEVIHNGHFWSRFR